MRLRNLIYTGILGAAMVSCSDEAPSAVLGVTTDKTSYKAGEKVTFHLDGDPDNIVFYSGESGHEYGLRDREYADNDLMVEFVSFTDYVKTVVPNFQVLVSSDFNGIYDAENVGRATWTDVTSDFTLPAETGKNTESGRVNLKKYDNGGDNGLFYIAFRYFDLPEGAERNRWVVRSMSIDKVSPEGAVNTLADVKTAGWQNVAMGGEMEWKLPGTQLLAAGDESTQGKDAWVVSKGFNRRSSEPATGITLKNLSTEMDSFGYVYEEPGVYEAVFASSSVWYNSSDYSLTTVRVVVTE